MSGHPVIGEIVARALAEDIGPGDITTELVISPDQRARGYFLAKQAGVLSGLDVAENCFRHVEPHIEFSPFFHEGQAFAAGDYLAEVRGSARALLTAERVALNFLQRLCGIATLTRQFVERVAGTRTRIVDTRKTTPGLRILEKRAVRAGGGFNHRFALFDGILLKDNHIALAGGIEPAVAAARAAAPHLLKIQVEVSSLEQLQEALAAGVDAVLLDNMSVEQIKEAVALAHGRVLVEASGGITLDNVASVAHTGVDFISIGALTHSAPAIDISLELQQE